MIHIAVQADQWVVKHAVSVAPDDVRLCQTHWPNRTCQCLHYEIDWLGERPDVTVYEVNDVWPHWSAIASPLPS